MITVFGATGYTGVLVSQALDRRKLPFRIAGRSAQKLEALSDRLSCHPQWVVADVHTTSTLSSLVEGTSVLINCVGPFTDLGEKVVRLAIGSKCHYLDSSNELGYIYRMQTYHKLAEKVMVSVVPACAFEVALADIAAALVFQKLETPAIDEMRVVYHLQGVHSSGGTRRSLLRSLATSWIGYQKGQWKGYLPGSHAKKEHIRGEWVPVLSIPSGESVTIPNHIPVSTVTVWMKTNPIQAIVGPILIPYLARFLRSIAGPWIQKIITLGSPQPTLNPENQNDCFQISIIAFDHKQGIRKTIELSGGNPYVVTGEIMADAAALLYENRVQKNGVISPAQVFENSSTDYLSRWGVSIHWDQ
uniref:Saccharopine dehydrogenase NADP binding domain-containing protein n=1 Tax=Anaerolinea thermolimosa TaxID=229919 RepID=A0A7C4KFA9_9CHLR